MARSATGKVVIGNCFPGFPVLENRAKGVQESLAAAAGIEILGPFDVKVAANENYAAWEALLAANPDAKALIGLCAPDIASLGKLQAANPDTPFVSGGYDLTAENLAEIKAGTRLRQPWPDPVHAGLPADQDARRHDHAAPRRWTSPRAASRRGHGDRDRRQRHRSRSACRRSPSPSSKRWQPRRPRPAAYYQPLVDGQIANWASNVEPIANESK